MGEEGVKEEGVEEVVVGKMERPSSLPCALVALCYHQ